VSSPDAVTVSERAKLPFETIAKGVTYALPLVYVCGFVILSLFEADYGIADLSLVRVKTLTAGLLFALFIIVPSLVSLRSFQLFGLKKAGGTPIPVSKPNLIYFYIIKISELYVLSVFASMMLLLFLAHRPTVWLLGGLNQEPGHFSLLILSVEITSTGILFLGIMPLGWVAKHFAVEPIRCTVLIFLISVLWLIWNFEMSDRIFFELVGWFYLVGLASIAAAWLIGQGKGLKSLDWELGILFAFCVFLPWFAADLYGSIKPAFGGGSPVSAKLYLKEDNAVLRSRTLDIHIIEETEQGYYVLGKTDTSKTAVFVPRSSVSTAQFNSEKK
jgi:hypothetical protein